MLPQHAGFRIAEWSIFQNTLSVQDLNTRYTTLINTVHKLVSMTANSQKHPPRHVNRQNPYFLLSQIFFFTFFALFRGKKISSDFSSSVGGQDARAPL